jgi:hypothetical protein
MRAVAGTENENLPVFQSFQRAGKRGLGFVEVERNHL